MSKYKPYPEYKDSGVDWIGEVPNGWEIASIKNIIKFSKNGVWGEEPGQLNDLPCVRVADFDRGSLVVKKHIPTMRFIKESEQKGRLLKKGDLLLEKSGGGDNQLVGQVVLYDKEYQAVCSNFVARLVLKDLFCSKFWNYVFSFLYDSKVNYRSIKQTSGIQNLDQNQYLSEPVGFPPLQEQTKIVAVLDQETARIDKLIAKKEEFIELLKQKRQALITHAVTKGLDPNVEMKDSGVEWIGEVPKGWGISPFFTLFKELKVKNSGLKNDNVLSLSYGNIIVKKVDRVLGLIPESYETYQIVEPGNIVFRLTDLQNDKRSLRSAIVKEKGIITSAYLAVEVNSGDSDYFNYLMRSYDLCKVFYTMGAGMRQSLNYTDMKWLPIVKPSNELQNEIVTYLDQKTIRIDTIVSKTQESIELLKQRRQAFITAAVTGKIDLRDVVVQKMESEVADVAA